ncbi:MAG: BMP family protein [Streptococcaceae bacterium]|jgi:basic membrane protein A|nr:BMP family protein [Streptococcaceae bacterium]
MKKTKILGLALAGLAAVSLFAGCRSTTGSANATKVAVITDLGGLNDRSFNESAFNGLKSWASEHNYKVSGAKGENYQAFQSNSASDYTTNYNSAISAGYNLFFGIGYNLTPATKATAKANPKLHFVIVDDVITGQKNVASASFADEQSAYLAGIAAAKASKTGKIGFIGGMVSDVITAFQVGFTKGAQSVNPNIKIDVQYANSYTDASKGQTISASMYQSGADVVYQCAGGVGAGTFAEAKALNQNRTEANKVWVIGVDQDQNYLGSYKSKDGKESNFVLVSTVKEVGNVVKKIADENMQGKFPGGKVENENLANGGVDLALDNADSSIKSAVATAKQKIIDGKIKVPAK